MQLFRAMCLAATVLLFACSQEEVLVIDGSSALLEAPYPMNYPSSAPKPNKVLRMVSNEEARILQERAEKDYLVYKVKMDSGEEGFILAQPNVHAQTKDSRVVKMAA